MHFSPFDGGRVPSPNPKKKKKNWTETSIQYTDEQTVEIILEKAFLLALPPKLSQQVSRFRKTAPAVSQIRKSIMIGKTFTHEGR